MFYSTASPQCIPHWVSYTTYAENSSVSISTQEHFFWKRSSLLHITTIKMHFLPAILYMFVNVTFCLFRQRMSTTEWKELLHLLTCWMLRNVGNYQEPSYDRDVISRSLLKYAAVTHFTVSLYWCIAIWRVNIKKREFSCFPFRPRTRLGCVIPAYMCQPCSHAATFQCWPLLSILHDDWYSSTVTFSIHFQLLGSCYCSQVVGESGSLNATVILVQWYSICPFALHNM